MEIAKGLHQMFYFYHRLRLLLCCGNGLDTWRIKHVPELFKDSIRGINATNLTMIEESHAFTTTHLIEIRRRGHNGDAPLLQHQQHLPQFLAAHWIYTRSGFIEKEHAGLMHQRTRERQFLLHTPRESPCTTVLKALYLRIDGLDAIVAFLDGGAEKRGKELQVFLDGQILIERELARHIAYTAADLAHLLHHVIAVYCHRACIGQQQ